LLLSFHISMSQLKPNRASAEKFDDVGAPDAFPA
jgi:hypothetical protein